MVKESDEPGPGDAVVILTATVKRRRGEDMRKDRDRRDALTYLAASRE